MYIKMLEKTKSRCNLKTEIIFLSPLNNHWSNVCQDIKIEYLHPILNAEIH